MAYEPKDGDISLFSNAEGKAKNGNAPDMKGTAFIEGVKYNVSVWTKTGENGRFLAGKIELPKQQDATSNDNAPVDDLPF